jgi:membrane-associated phospholipid phosphatase
LKRAPASSTGALAGGAIFLVAATLYAALGNAVSHVAPAGLDAAARSLAGEAPRVAWVFTASCLWPVLTAFGLAGSVVAVRAPAWRARIVFAIVATLAGWQISNVLKDYFARPRPAYWVLHQETTFAYSSGHAMFAVLVYWLWAYHAGRSSLPGAPRTLLCAVLAGWGAGVIWSRLALGAHYPSDLAGGVLLGIAILAAASTIARGSSSGCRKVDGFDSGWQLLTAVDRARSGYGFRDRPR